MLKTRLLFFKNLPTSRANNSRILRIKNARFSMNLLLYEDKHVKRFSNLHYSNFNQATTNGSSNLRAFCLVQTTSLGRVL